MPPSALPQDRSPALPAAALPPSDEDAALRLAHQLDRLAAALPIEAAATREDARQLMSLAAQLAHTAAELRRQTAQAWVAALQADTQALDAVTLAATAALAEAMPLVRVIRVTGDVLILAQTLALQKWSLMPGALQNLQRELAG